MKKNLFTFFVMFLPISTFSQALFELEKEVDGMWNLQIVQYDTDNNYIDQLPYFNISTMSTDMGNFYCSSFTNNTYMVKVMDKNYNLIYSKIETGKFIPSKEQILQIAKILSANEYELLEMWMAEKIVAIAESDMDLVPAAIKLVGERLNLDKEI